MNKYGTVMYPQCAKCGSNLNPVGDCYYCDDGDSLRTLYEREKQRADKLVKTLQESIDIASRMAREIL